MKSTKSILNLGIFCYFFLISLFACESEGQGNNTVSVEKKTEIITDEAYRDNLPLPKGFEKVNKHLNIAHSALFLSKNGEFRVVIATDEQEVKENSDMIDEKLKKTIIIFVFRAFIHTSISDIRLVAYPILYDKIPIKDGRPIISYKRNLQVTRQKALKVLEETIATNNFEELVGDYIEDVFDEEMANEKFHKITDTNQYPGLDQVYEALFE